MTNEIQPMASASETSGQQPADVDNIWKACAYGDFDKLRLFVKKDPTLVNKTDEQGFYPIQWAALNNRVAVTTFLLEHGASANSIDGTGVNSFPAVQTGDPLSSTIDFFCD